MSAPPQPVSVLFVCTGNICRSPMAEAVLKHAVKEQGLAAHFGTIDSCGTGGYHVGDSADYRTRQVCRKHSVVCDSTARKLRPSDFDFDYIFGLDAGHVRYLRSRAPPGCKAQIRLFGAVDDNKDVEDPYYGGIEDFNQSYIQCDRYARKFLASLGFKVSKA